MLPNGGAGIRDGYLKEVRDKVVIMATKSTSASTSGEKSSTTTTTSDTQRRGSASSNNAGSENAAEGDQHAQLLRRVYNPYVLPGQRDEDATAQQHEE